MAQPTDIRKLGVNIRRRASSSQAAVTGTAGAALATTAVTQSSPWGFASQAQGDLITTRLNQALVDIAALTTLVNEQRTALINLGAIKGEA